MTLPRLALSINQPWAHLIVAGVKQIENRNWTTEFRGEIMIHTGLKLDKDAIHEVRAGRHPVDSTALALVAPGFEPPESYQTGGIIGIAEIVDVIRGFGDLKRQPADLDTTWFVGRYGFVLRNARPIEFIPCVGALSLFEPDFSLTYKPKPEPRPRPPRARAEAAPVADLFS